MDISAQSKLLIVALTMISKARAVWVPFVAACGCMLFRDVLSTYKGEKEESCNLFESLGYTRG